MGNGLPASFSPQQSRVTRLRDTFHSRIMYHYDYCVFERIIAGRLEILDLGRLAWRSREPYSNFQPHHACQGPTASGDLRRSTATF
jgi:hypothetical protein